MKQGYRALAKTIFGLLTILLLPVLTTRAQTDTPPPVTIPGTQELTINSAIVDQEFSLKINLPGGYENSGKEYPVLYLLDAQWDFPLLNALYGSQYYDGFIPAMIIVGITWGGTSPNSGSLRARDFTPTRLNNNQQNGNAANFLSFIKKELDPFVASKFRTKKGDRALMGSSLGGLFTVYAFLNEPAFFNRYILTSPALFWDNEVIYSYVKNFEQKKPDHPVRMYVAIGDQESGLMPGYEKWLKFLKEKKYKNVAVDGKVLDNTGHSGSKAEGYSRGLQYVFKKPSLVLKENVLKQYTGQYSNGGNNIINVKQEKGRLVLHVGNGQQIVLDAASEKDFYIAGQFSLFHFQKDAAGKVTGFNWERYDNETFVKKVEK